MELDFALRSDEGFGAGLHHCLGLHIVRREARVLTNALLDTFPNLRIADMDYGDSWALWAARLLEMEPNAV